MALADQESGADDPIVDGDQQVIVDVPLVTL